MDEMTVIMIWSYNVSLCGLVFLPVSGFFSIQPHDVTFFGLLGASPPDPHHGSAPGLLAGGFSSPRSPASAPPKPKSDPSLGISYLLRFGKSCVSAHIAPQWHSLASQLADTTIDLD